MTHPIHVTRRGAVLEVRIERGKANAIDAATSRIMGDVFASFRDDPELRVAILTNHDEPRLTLRILSLEAVQEDITREFKALLLQELDGAADLSIGAFTP